MTLLVLLALFVSSSGRANEPFDLASVDNKITKEPEYVSKQPLYGLVVIGAEAEIRYWMVLDKSAEDGDKYDVVYVDFNGNGDLTEPKEKVVSKSGESRVKFQFPDVVDRKSGTKHTDFYLSLTDRDPATQMVSLMWNGKHKFGGGYPERKGESQWETPHDFPRSTGRSCLRCQFSHGWCGL